MLTLMRILFPTRRPTANGQDRTLLFNTVLPDLIKSSLDGRCVRCFYVKAIFAQPLGMCTHCDQIVIKLLFSRYKHGLTFAVWCMGTDFGRFALLIM